MNIRTPGPAPTPAAQRVLFRVTDARKALERGEQSWNEAQIEDALRSAEFFIKAARDALSSQPDRPTPHIPQPT